MEKPLLSYKIEIVLFILFWGIFAYFLPTEPGWNVNSRLGLTYAIIDNHSFKISEYCKSADVETEDTAFHEGEYYSDKIVGTSLLGLPGYTIARIADGISGGEMTWDVKRYITTIFSTCIFAALSTIFLVRIFMLCELTFAQSLLMVFFYAAGTLSFPYSFLFMPYAPANFFMICVIYFLTKYKLTPELLPLFRIGLLLGAAMLCEYTYCLAAAGIFIYIFFAVHQKKNTGYIITGAAIPLALFAVYLLICFGKLVIPYSLEKNDLFREGMSRGIMGITLPSLPVLYYITFHSYRGLFFYSPFLLLGVLNIFLNIHRKDERAGGLLSLWILLAYLYLNSSYYMWWGGWTNGARILIPVIPFLAVETAKLAGRTKPVFILITVLGLLSIFLNFSPAAVDPQTPQGYQKNAEELIAPSFSHKLESPVIFQIKKFLDGTVGYNAGYLLFNLKGLASLIPLMIWIAALLIVLMYLEFYYRAKNVREQNRVYDDFMVSR